VSLAGAQTAKQLARDSREWCGCPDCDHFSRSGTHRLERWLSAARSRLMRAGLLAKKKKARNPLTQSVSPYWIAPVLADLARVSVDLRCRGACWAFLRDQYGAPSSPVVVISAPPKAAKPKRIWRKVSFYDTPEWQRVRYVILTKYGRTCMLCRTTEGEMHVDHIRPRSKFPDLELDPDNLQVLCKACNLGKSNLDDTDFRP